jgi:hypothetical protein
MGMQLRNLKLMKAVIFFALILFAVCANAELFKWKDADGNIIFSDQPPAGSDKAESEVKPETLPHINTVPALDLTKRRATQPTESGSNKVNYKDFAIVSPLHDSEVRENSGKIQVTIQIQPDNFSEHGHQLVIHMDGVEVYKGINTSVSLDNVDRGTHNIKASIVNNRGYVLRETRLTTFTLQRFHI